MLQLHDAEHVKSILQSYADVNFAREHISQFHKHLLQRTDSWFVDARGVGLIYLTDILPHFAAVFNVVFWDKKFGKGRRQACLRVIATAFVEFDLQRVQAMIPELNKPMWEHVLPKMGFRLEGRHRLAWRNEANSFYDLMTFGMLRNECTAAPVEHLRV